MRATPEGPRCMVPNPETGSPCMHTNRYHSPTHRDAEGHTWDIHPDPQPWSIWNIKERREFGRTADRAAWAQTGAWWELRFDPRPVFEMSADSLTELLETAMKTEEERRRKAERQIAPIREALAIAMRRENRGN